jgi:RNA polymerase sigma-70 factor (ECF subfamily)
MIEGLLSDNPGDVTSDSALLLLIEQRDEAAMARLFQRHSRVVYSVALRVLQEPTQAEDVLQEVFMQVWRKPISLDLGRGCLSSLLAVTARNRSIDLLRRRKQTQSTDGYDLPSSFNLASESEQRLLLDRVRTVAINLPEDQQTALRLAFFEGLTHTEIAARTGIPLGTIKTRIRSALQTLGRTLTA